jgi:hypothetical protein
VISQIGPEGIGAVRLDGSGNGTASCGPLTAREVWNPQNAHVSVATNAAEATCTIYVGDSPIQQNLRDATFTGSSGDSTDRINADTVKSGSKIWGVWTGGDPGSQAIIRVTGTKNV